MKDKTRVDRRSFLRIASAAAAMGVMPINAMATSGSSVSASSANGVRIMVIGAGVAGTRAAIQLKQANPALRVILADPMIDSQKRYQNKINHMLTLESSIQLAAAGIEITAKKIVKVDADKKRVWFDSGAKLDSDILVFAPGVDFKSAPVTTNSIHPLNQTQVQQQVVLMREGGTVVVGIPRAPYQYPQGPYMQVSKMATYLQLHNPAAKVLVLDQNAGSALFEQYRKQWQDGSGSSLIELLATNEDYVRTIEPTMGRIETQDGHINASVIAVMPQQRAGVVARAAGLALNADWCQVNSETLASIHYPHVYVLGDANDAAIDDKTAFTAVRQADRFVRNIIRELV